MPGTPLANYAFTKLCVHDLEALCARAEAAGGTVVTKPGESVVPNLLVGFVKDPEAHLAEVIQQVNPS